MAPENALPRTYFYKKHIKNIMHRYTTDKNTLFLTTTTIKRRLQTAEKQSTKNMLSLPEKREKTLINEHF